MKTGILTLLALSIFTMLAATSDVSAQGRGRGRYNRGWDRKCEKFVNCHDARDGRWDGRGPRRTVSRRLYYSPQYFYSPYYRDRYYYSPYYRDQYYPPYYGDRYYGGYRLRRVYRRW